MGIVNTIQLAVYKGKYYTLPQTPTTAKNPKKPLKTKIPLRCLGMEKRSILKIKAAKPKSITESNP